jgi:antitoxin component YwqK of YwqJK toxin-antitoxin module
MRNETDFKEGIYKEYYKSGAIRIDARFKDKKPHGLIKEYYEEGILSAEDGYEFGRHVGSRRYSRLGTLVASSGKLKEQEPVVLEGKREEGNVFKEYIEQMEHAPAEEQKIQPPPIVQETKPEVKEEPKKEIVEEKKPEKKSLSRIEALREALTKSRSKEQAPARPDSNIEAGQVEPKAVEVQKPVENEPQRTEEKKIEFVRNEIEKALEGKIESENKEDEPRTEEIGREPQIEITGEERTVKEYYLSGAVKSERTYKGDKLHGLTKEYYESSELMAEMSYVNGELDSQTRFDKTGRFFYKWKK